MRKITFFRAEKGMVKALNKPLSILLSILVLTSFTTTVFSSTEYFTYDSNGNLIRDGSFCYDYNDAHRLKAVTDCAGNTLAQYWYNYAGRKIKAVEGDATIYYWANGEFVEIIGGPYHGNYTYYFANGERVAWKGPDGKMHYIHGDHLGSTVMVTDENGNVEEETTYYPYGGIRSGGNLTRYLYTGQEYIKELGLYNYQGRDYKPGIPGFIEPDPIMPDVYDPQTLNRYSYVRNNPVKYTDPEGNILFVPFVLMVGVGVLFECNYLSSTPNPTLEGTVTEGVIGTSATAAGLATGGAAAAAGAGTATTGAAAAASMQISENVMHGDDATEGVGEAVIFGAVAGKALQAAGKVISGPKTVSVEGQKFSRYMSNTELESVKETGMLRGGKPGKTYFTPNKYQKMSSAEQKLALPDTPEVRVDFKILNNPQTFKGPVSPKYGQPGGGTEYWTSDQVSVNIYRVKSLKK